MHSIMLDVIRIKYANGASLEELANQYELDYYDVKLICENADEYYNAEFDDAPDYSQRHNRCKQCGSAYDELGFPIDCAGECEECDGVDFIRNEDDPQELDF